MHTHNVVVMPNLFFKRRIAQVFDLKGSTRNRYADMTKKSSQSQNNVMLDQNFMECIYHLFVFFKF